MHAQKCHLMTHDGGFFDITHTFKAGEATYHILGLRKDRPTYKNTYYIFNCTGDQHESTNEPLSKSVQFRLPDRSSRQSSGSRQRPVTAHNSKTSSSEDLTTDQTKKRRSPLIRSRTRTESPKKIEIDTTAIQESFTKAMRSDRQLLMTSFRKEMNNKKKVILRSIKKEKEELLQATLEANKKEEIIRLLEEQKNTLTSVYEKFVDETTSSIDSLKRTLIETLETQHNTSQSIEQIQLNLIQTIEQEVQKIVLKNEEILKSTTDETNAIDELQKTLIQKIEQYISMKKNDDATLLRLFSEQKQAFHDVMTHQQQTFSLDSIKQTMLDALNEQKSSSSTTNIIKNTEQSTTDIITNLPSEQVSMDNNPISNKTNNSLPRVKSSQYLRTTNQSLSRSNFKNPTDQHLFKVSIRTPEPAHLFAKLSADGMECSRRLHTLCQRDIIQNDVFNCYIAPPNKDGPYEVTIYAKTNKETAYRAAISIRLPGSNISQSITFPIVHQSFERHQCILIEPLQRLLKQNEQVLIHMIVPGASTVKIRNGDDTSELDINEYKKDVVKKKIRIRGDVYVIGCWDKKTDSTICVFNMI